MDYTPFLNNVTQQIPLIAMAFITIITLCVAVKTQSNTALIVEVSYKRAYDSAYHDLKRWTKTISKGRKIDLTLRPVNESDSDSGSECEESCDEDESQEDATCSRCGAKHDACLGDHGSEDSSEDSCNQDSSEESEVEKCCHAGKCSNSKNDLKQKSHNDDEKADKDQSKTKFYQNLENFMKSHNTEPLNSEVIQTKAPMSSAALKNKSNAHPEVEEKKSSVSDPDILNPKSVGTSAETHADIREYIAGLQKKRQTIANVFPNIIPNILGKKASVALTEAENISKELNAMVRNNLLSDNKKNTDITSYIGKRIESFLQELVDSTDEKESPGAATARNNSSEEKTQQKTEENSHDKVD